MNRDYKGQQPTQQFLSLFARLTEQLLPSHFSRYHATLIAQFLRKVIVQGNVALIAFIVVLRVIGRFLIILSFAVTLKAVVAAIRPDLVLRAIDKIIHLIGIDMKISYAELPPILMGLVLGVNGMNWFVVFLTERMNTRLNVRIIGEHSRFGARSTMANDLFLLERVPDLAQNLIRCMDTSVFILLMIVLIFVFSPGLSMMLIPLLAILVIVQIYSGRSRLKLNNARRKAKIDYVTYTTEEGRQRKRLQPEDIVERREYLAVKDKVRVQDAMKNRFDSFIGAVVLATIIYYLFHSNIELDAFYASLLIVFILALRQTIGAGKQLSSQISLVLELRKDTYLLNQILEVDNFVGEAAANESEALNRS